MITMAEIQLKLTETEYADTGKSVSISWLINGINLEDAQYMVTSPSYLGQGFIWLKGCIESRNSTASPRCICFSKGSG
jgi:hypothetical protein